MLGKFFSFRLRQPHFSPLDADGGGTLPGGSNDDHSDDNGDDGDNDDPDNDDPADNEPKYKVKYNGEEKEIPVSELVTFAQKGMNYDHVKEELDKLRSETGATKKEIEVIAAALKRHGYEGTPTEIADVLQAQAAEIPVDDYRQQQAEQARMIEEALQNDPRFKTLVEREEEATKQRVYNQDFMELKGMFPGEKAKTLQEIKNFDKFAEYRHKGLSVEDSYTLANKEVAAHSKAKPTGEDKDHMIKTGGGAAKTGDREIPKDSISLWRAQFPEATMAELKAKYNRTFN